MKWFNDAKGFGFIQPDGGGKDLFVHHANVQSEGGALMEGQKVSFRPMASEKGPFACDVQPVS